MKLVNDAEGLLDIENGVVMMRQRELGENVDAMIMRIVKERV